MGRRHPVFRRAATREDFTPRVRSPTAGATADAAAGRVAAPPASDEETHRRHNEVERTVNSLAGGSGKCPPVRRVRSPGPGPRHSRADFSTRNPMRDIQVRSPLFLNARRHPAISFRIDGVQHREGTWTGTGSLTVKGVSAPVECTVQSIERKGDAVVFTAHGKVDRYAHSITMMPGMAARYLTFEVTTHANKA
ncbi:YceI family protein [Streptomyces sp. NPDC002763]|uniref:YceI family protein n=1 Tax=Streptomyces sp. NPDC002763 TaxID=3154427 RepID=UPI003319841B